MSLLSFDDAFKRILAAVQPLGIVEVPLSGAAGRVLAGPVIAERSQPPFDASAMDGYAVRAADVTEGATLLQIGRSEAGHGFGGEVGAGQCVRILTGAPVPTGADAVVMQEETDVAGDMVTFHAPASSGQNIRPRGHDFRAGDSLLRPGPPITPYAIALAAAANSPHLAVFRQPLVTLVSTGDELVAPGGIPGPDQIIASNAPALAALFVPHSQEVMDAGIIPDDERSLAAALGPAIEASDVVVTIGGASVGDRDYVLPVLKSLGVEIDFWKIAMRPGKPLMFGRKGDTLVFGLPGNPVSALVTATVLVVPAIRALADGSGHLETRKARLKEALPPNGIRRHFLRGALMSGADGILEATPFSQTDSAHLTSLAKADCLIVQPENDPGSPAGAEVEVVPLSV